MTKIVLDSSFVIALAIKTDTNRAQVQAIANSTRYQSIIPVVVFPEAFFNNKRLSGNRNLVNFADSLAKRNPKIEPLTTEDFARAVELMQLYGKTELDFVDCCITAIAERLNIHTIATFDRRDFSIIRPRHIDYFDIVP